MSSKISASSTIANDGISNRDEIIIRLVSFSLSGENIAPNIAAIRIAVIIQHTIATKIQVLSNIRLIIVYTILKSTYC